MTIENNQIVSREKRNKLWHAQFDGRTHPECGVPRGHGFDAVSQSYHVQMMGAIADFQVLLARGMGAGAYNSMIAANIRPVITDVETIDDAVSAYLAGILVDHIELLH